MTNVKSPTGLGYKIRRSAFRLAILVVAIMGIVLVVAISLSMRERQLASQSAAAKILALNIQNTLNRQIDALYELSRNPLTLTAFVDNGGREMHFSPYLRNFNALGNGIQSVALLDYQGRPISGDTKSPEFAHGHQTAFIEQLLKSGKPGLQIHREADVHVWVGFPIRYPDMEEPIGLVMGMIPLEENLSSFVETLEAGQGFSLSVASEEIFHSVAAAERYDVVRYEVTHPNFDLYLWQIELFSLKVPWRNLAFEIAGVLLVTGLFLVWLVWEVAGLMAERLTGRLRKVAEAVASSRPDTAEIPVDGSGDEVDQLAVVLQRAFEEYEALAQSLEQMVQQRTLRLSESEARYRQSFEVNTAVKLMIDPQNGTIIDANSAALAFYGLSRDVLLGQSVKQIEVNATSDLHLSEQGAHLFSQHRQANGNIRDVEIYAGPAQVGEQTYIYAIIHDVTERIEAERALVEAKQAAEAANTAKSRFLAMMSHEIRTPMNGILGMAQLLLTPGVTEEERMDYASVILSSGQTLLTLLNDILDLSKVEAGKVNLEQLVFQPARLIHEVGALFVSTAQSRQLAFHTNWHGDRAAQYLGDPYRLKQMLSNYLSNALKFTQSGSVVLEVKELSRDAQHAMLEFSVRDTGPGIPFEKQGHLFQPFNQADDSTTRQFGGTGLGLSIVKSLSLMMGGDAGLVSEPGKGACFWFRVEVGLVAIFPETDTRTDAQLEGDRDLGAKKLLRGHVLVVEDDPINRKVIDTILTRLGLSVSLAENGLRGVEFVQDNEPFDLVFMDVRMPVMDGYAATARIRAYERAHQRSAVPIIALTADAFQSDRLLALDAGMSDFLPKPIDVKALESLLHHWLEEIKESI